MILVTLGTQNNSFHRLLEEVQKCIDKKIITEEVIVQAGATKFKSNDMKIFKLMPYEELNKYIDQANFIITHGGVGSIVTCLKKKKKVIAVPRYHKYGEHVNDHQLQIIETFDGQGFIKGLQSVEDLEKAISELPYFKPEEFTSNTENVIRVVENFIENKTLLFSAYSLDIGGIEKALVTLLNNLQEKGYNITLVLEKKQGIFLNEINPKIKIIEYTPNDDKNIIKRKFKNFKKRRKFKKRYKNEFGFSACFATYSKPASFVARTASKNSYLWGHADYLAQFKGDKEETKKFFKQRKYNKFKRIIFVSKEGKQSFLELFPNMKEKVMHCNNLIDGKKILEMAEEKIELEKDDITTFLNVGRHDETQKKLTRLIETSKKLKEDGYKFRVLFVGDGPDNKLYKDLVKKENLTENIIFVGKKQNPYPYYKISDCVVLTSDYEGYPVVFLESFILNKPIITTKVSDYEQIMDKWGYVTEKSAKDLYEKMKKIIENGYKISEKFDYEKYNEDIMEKIEKLF